MNKFITFDDIIVNVNEIVDIERPNVDGRNQLIVNLSSGRSITATRPTEADVDNLVKKFAELLNPEDFNIPVVGTAQ